ncbi:MAG: hypothetical protein ABSF63_15110 [Candidatus Bathyarchaeia archaeon]|jgi:hypothetical protein
MTSENKIEETFRKSREWSEQVSDIFRPTSGEGRIPNRIQKIADVTTRIDTEAMTLVSGKPVPSRKEAK